MSPTEGWGATLLGAVAAMAWLGGPLPLLPRVHAPGVAERAQQEIVAHPRRKRPLVLRAIPSAGD